MLELLEAHSSLITTLTNFGMLVVWIIYFQVFWKSYRRTTRPSILITRAAGLGPKAACFVTNMSGETIYIEAVVARVFDREEQLDTMITDVEESDDQASDHKQKTCQGPLLSGQYVSVGSFENILLRASGGKGLDAISDTAYLQITVVADYASENLLTGASRSFSFRYSDQQVKVEPREPRTIQIKGRKQRRALGDLLSDN